MQMMIQSLCQINNVDPHEEDLTKMEGVRPYQELIKRKSTKKIQIMSSITSLFDYNIDH